MDEANQIGQQVLSLSNALDSEAKRVWRWAIYCLLFAIAVSALTVAAKSLVFLLVAMFAWFFAWNRWKLARLLRSYLPPPSQDQQAWMESAIKRLENPPAWCRYSEYGAGVTFLLLFALITIEVTATSGIWMRVLYGVCWLLSLAAIVIRVRNARQNHRQSGDAI